MTSALHPAPAGLPAAQPAARGVGLTKQYGKGDTAVHALAGVDVEIGAGRFTAIMGPSGSGKSTLMHCMAALDKPTSGSVFLGDVEVNRLDDKRLTRLRRDRIGFVFQAYNLVPTLTALENITLPADIAGRPVDKAWLDTVVETLGLRDRLRHRPNELSGGQQQRVACARALAGRPAIVFADEPTGNLDSRTGAEVLAFLAESVRRTGQTVVMVTHDPSAAAYADHVMFLADGRIVDEMTDPNAERVLERMKAFDAAEAPPIPVTWAAHPGTGKPTESSPGAPDPVAVSRATHAAPPRSVTAPDPATAAEPAAPGELATEPRAADEARGMADWSQSDWDAWLNEKQAQAARPDSPPAQGPQSNGKGHGDPFANPPYRPEA